MFNNLLFINEKFISAGNDWRELTSRLFLNDLVHRGQLKFLTYGVGL
jgi:hypothetical protein